MTTMLKLLSPEGLARFRREADVIIRREAIKARTKAISKPRIMWAAGLLYLLDGVCRNIKL
jgi:hypothetical protein